MVDTDRPHRRATTATIAVAAMLLGGVVVNVVDYPLIEGTMSQGWRSVHPVSPGDIERPSFSLDRYGAYFALRDHTDDPVVIISEKSKATNPGRYYGIGDASLVDLRDFDPVAVLDELEADPGFDLDAYVVAEGPYSDGEDSFRIALLDEDATEIVALRDGVDDLLLIDFRLLPEDVQQQVAA